MTRVPYADIDTVLLDVGNTLISIDFDRVAAELLARKRSCAAHALRRAEAAARPGYSNQLFVTGPRPDRSLFHSYLCAILERVESLTAVSPIERDELVTELEPVLRPGGRASALWRMVMPGVPQALERLQKRGLTLAVVSNSDGTCAQSLEEAGLLRYVNFVIDSADVGVEKPDPRIFEMAVARSGANPRRTLYVGDLYHADVLGARRAGLHALLLDPYGDWPPLDCDRVPDLSAVADKLESARDFVTATAGDIPQLVRVINAAYEVEKFFVAGDRTDAETIRRMMTTGAFLIVRNSDAPVQLLACVYVEIRGARGYFGMLSVDPSAQGRGLGRALVNAVEGYARAAGCVGMDIRVVDLRLELPAFYHRLGYAESGVIEPVDDPRALRPFQFVTMSKPLL